MRETKITSVDTRNIAKPKTVLEKYNKLKLKNKNIDQLTKAFDLEILL